MYKSSRIVLVLDSSGSMSSQRNDVIGGINETIRQQREAMPDDKDTMFTVITFSNSTNAPNDMKLSSIPYFTSKDYNPSGSTALFDAIGHTIERYQDEHNVICLIMTDGEENASSSFTYKRITEMIQRVKETRNWNFIYLSEDISTFKQGAGMGLSSSAMNCNNVMIKKNKLGSKLGGMNCQVALTQMRKGEQNVKIQSDDNDDDCKPAAIIDSLYCSPRSSSGSSCIPSSHCSPQVSSCQTSCQPQIQPRPTSSRSLYDSLGSWLPRY